MIAWSWYHIVGVRPMSTPCGFMWGLIAGSAVWFTVWSWVYIYRSTFAATGMITSSSLVGEIPDVSSPAAAGADLVIIEAQIGADLCVVVTCPCLFRRVAACVSFWMGQIDLLLSRVIRRERSICSVYFCNVLLDRLDHHPSVLQFF